MVRKEIPKLASNKVNRGEQVLNRAVAAHKMSECGMKALLAAVDPFHDKPIEGLRGWPDLETGPSVIRHWKQSTTVKAIDDGSSIMIYTWPILDACTCNITTRRNSLIDTITPGVSTDVVIAPVTISSYNAANSGLPSLPFVPDASYNHAIPGSYFQDGASRLIGMGVEVHDVTAELYKQGTITCFQIPQTTADVEDVVVKAQTVGALSYTNTAVTAARLNRFPSNLANIMTYPTSRQWDAKEGAYVVVPFSGHENPPNYAEYMTPFVNNTPTSVLDAPNALNSTGRYLGTYATGGVSGDPFIFNAHQYAPVNSRGIYLTGLNANSTFTITTSFYTETFPVQSSPLLPMAAPSCPFDPKALALISIIMQEMPVGVPVRENPMGEWFWQAVEGAIPALAGVASTFFPTFSPLIGGASSAITNYAHRQVAKQHLKAEKPRSMQKAAVKNDIKQIVKQDAALLHRASNKK